MKRDYENLNPDSLPVGRMIHILSHQLQRKNHCIDKSMGLTTMQSHILHFILMNCGHREIFQRDIEAEFDIRKPTATGILQLLEKKDFITRKGVEHDGRLKLLVPTKRAVQYGDRIMENLEEIERILINEIPEEDVRDCKRTLWRMIVNAKDI